MGSPADDPQIDNDEKPQHRLDIPYDYWMGRTPVTNGQFAAFVRDSSYATDAEKDGWAWLWLVEDGQWQKVEGASWRHPLGPDSDLETRGDHPVVSVSFHDARAYCRWLDTGASNALPEGYHFRLPSEAEWEKAARGPDARVWPWGDHFEPTLCNYGGSGSIGVVPVGAHSPDADSVYGLADMAGNIWEWTTTLWGNSRYERSYQYPYRLGDGRDREDADDGYYRIIRGGSFKDGPDALRCACRDLDPPTFSLNNLGLRVTAAPRP
jgi:formylglycine-generating enzyme required for sulfatase activity